MSQYYREVIDFDSIAGNPRVRLIHALPVEVDEIPEVKEMMQRESQRDLMSKMTIARIEELERNSDPWHRVSDKPPQPEDFKPTGYIHAIDDEDNHHRLNQAEWIEWSKVTTYIYWRKITPPTKWMGWARK